MPLITPKTPSPILPFAFAASLFAVSCSDPQEVSSTAPKPPPTVRLWEVAAGPVETRRSWPATIEPLRVLEVVAPANGRVVESSIQAGDCVDTGAVLITMRFPEDEAARESVARRAELLEREVARLESLVAGGSVSDAAAAAKRAEQLDAQARLRAIEALLEEGAILAPSTGMVLENRSSPGSPVVEGTVLARITDSASHGVRIEVPNPELKYFESAGSLAVVPDQAAIAALAIDRIVRHASVRPNTTRLELWLATGAGIDAPAAAKVIYESSREALLIPWAAVATDDERAWVGRVDRKSGEVRRVPVALGATSGTRIEVIEGLSPGDWVLRHDPRTFADGAVVAPETAAPSEGP